MIIYVIQKVAVGLIWPINGDRLLPRLKYLASVLVEGLWSMCDLAVRILEAVLTCASQTAGRKIVF